MCNPPVSDAIQGAYLIAALAPACIIAGLAIIFKDIVEGLGCLLGGFCLGMWFLTLKDNGLIQQQGGRIGLIVGLAGAALALAFSHHTRHYGLLGCISFAGATVIVLGIDCFSKAGLKEFWLYVWGECDQTSDVQSKQANSADLNPNLDLFPPHMSSYQVTRGIKVETAAIIILAVLGVMSQMKLWIIVQKRRREREAQRRQAKGDRDQQDALRGNEIEEAKKRDIAGWEHAYDGGKAAAEASVSNLTASTNHDSTYHSQPGSLKKSSVSIREVRSDAEGLETIEMGSMSRRSSRVGSASRRNSKDKGKPSVREIPSEIAGEQPQRSSQKIDEALQSLETVSEASKRSSSRKSYVVKGDDDDGHWEDSDVEKPAPPGLTPLPFTVPAAAGDGHMDEDDDLKSVATVGETVNDFDVAKPNRVSLLGTTHQRSSIGTANRPTRYDEAPGLMVPHLDDDRSSVAATLDGLTDADLTSLPKLSRPGSPAVGKNSQEKSSVTTTIPRRHSASSLRGAVFGKEDEPSLAEAETSNNRRHSLTSPTEQPESSLGSLANLATKENPERQTASPVEMQPLKRLSHDSSGGPLASNKAGLTKDALPEGQSHMVHLFRTNEWAKHQAIADKPNVDDVAPPSEPGIGVAYGSETAAPVNVTELQHDAFTPQPAVVSRNSSTKSNNPYRMQSSAPLGRSNTNQSTATVSHDGPKRQSSSKGYNLSRNSSTTTIKQQKSQKAQRNTSANLLNQPLVESAGEDSFDPMSASSYNLMQQARQATIGGTSTPNLLDRRQELLRGRQSSMSFANPDVLGNAAFSSSHNLLTGANGAPTSPASPAADDDNISLSSRRKQLASMTPPSDEDMTLAQRRQLIQRSQSQGQQSHARNQQPTAGASRAQSQQQRYATISRQASWGPAPQQPHIYDSHRPQRGPSTSAAQRVQRMASWRGDLGGPSQRQSSASYGAVGADIDESRARMMGEQMSRGVRAEQQASQSRKRAHEIDQRMRDGSMLDLHREKLRAMERKTGSGNA